MVKRAIVYARVSGDDRSKDGRNLDLQLEMGRDYALKNGYEIVAELAEDDRGASGASIDLPQLNKVRAMAEAGEFDVLVVRELDRLSRDLAKQLFVEDSLKRYGVTIRYALFDYPDTPEGDFNKHVRASVAELERATIRERNIRGRRNVVRRGRIMLHGTHPPYGYRLSEDGATLVTDDFEASIVQSVFGWYTQGNGTDRRLSSVKIAEKLTQMGVPTWADQHCTWLKQSGHGVWAHNSVMDILHNPVYRGVWSYGKESQPEEAWLSIAVPAIVTEDLWQAAQERAVENTIISKRNTRRPYLLQHRLTCGQCGHKIGARPGRNHAGYYVCWGRHHAPPGDGHRCALPFLRVDSLDALVWGYVREQLAKPEQLEIGLQEYHLSKEETVAPLRGELSTVETRLATEERKRKKLLDLYLEDRMDRDTLVEKQAELDRTIADLVRQRSRLTTQIEQDELREDEIRDLVTFARQIAGRIDGGGCDIELRRAILEELDVQGVVSVEDGRRVIRLTSVLNPEAVSIATEDTETLAR